MIGHRSNEKSNKNKRKSRIKKLWGRTMDVVDRA